MNRKIFAHFLTKIQTRDPRSRKANAFASQKAKLYLPRMTPVGSLSTNYVTFTMRGALLRGNLVPQEVPCPKLFHVKHLCLYDDEIASPYFVGFAMTANGRIII